MKILAIRIKNLASLEGTTTIDFSSEPLRSAGIFAITGATGAGKSTILDALCLALYGKTPRYLQAKEIGVDIVDVPGSTLSQGDVRAILRDGTAEGFAEVDFVGIDALHYRASWSVRRARSKADGSMQPDQMSLRNITTHIDIPGKKQEVLNEIARLVGLNFDQFTRSVLLAQGDFTAFMKANKDEKSSLLEKLTGTHIYSEISKNIFERFRFEEQRLQKLNVKKEGIDLLSEEDLKVFVGEQTELEFSMGKLHKEIEGLGIEIAWHQGLIDLHQNTMKANEAFKVAQDSKEAAKDRIQKIQLLEKVEQTRSWVDAYVYSQEQLSQKEKLLHQLEQSKEVIEENKGKLEDALSKEEENYQLKVNTLSDMLPVMEQAKELDILLEEKKEQLQKVKLEFEKVGQRKVDQQKLLQDKQAELFKCRTQIDEIEQWKSKYSNKSAIAENKDLILSKFEDAHKLLTQCNILGKELLGLEESINDGENESASLEKQLTEKVKEWEKIVNSNNQKSNEVLLIPIEKMNLDKLDADQAIENLLKAEGIWQQYYAQLLELENLKSKQLADHEDFKGRAIRLEDFKKELISVSAQKENAAQILQKAQLAAAENVETLREQLVEGEACPVCGSETHPYITHNTQLDRVLSVVQDAFNQSENQYLDVYRNYNAEEKAFEILSQRIQKQAEELKNREGLVQKAKELWEQYDVAKTGITIAIEDKANWLATQLLNFRNRQSELALSIQLYEKEKQQLDSSKDTAAVLKEKVDQYTDKVRSGMATLELLKEQRRSKREAEDKSLSDLNEIEKILSSYFLGTSWMENWKSSPELFVEEIKKFANKWKENTDLHSQLALESTALDTMVKEFESQLEKITIEFGERSKSFYFQQQKYEDIQKQRGGLLGGNAVTEVEQALRKDIEDTQKKRDELRELQQELIKNYAAVKAQKDEVLSGVGSLRKDVEKGLEKISQWLNVFNENNNQLISFSQLQELLVLPTEWIEGERIALKAIEEQLLRSIAVLKERKEAIEKHLSKSVSDRSLDSLKSLLEQAKQLQQAQGQRKGELSYRLLQDKLNKDKVAELLKDTQLQSATTEKWSKLNEIIGSADGKKFRQIAQEYTLDVLLGYANIHLQTLSPRYRIERIAVSLGLQVVDMDMGDEVRTVYSLSGGESFLVSLALALGLASLSSSRMKVESLFIDEGFGSLDPATLNVAMDALERLHNQGRKVGVISHVQEMTERIATQIKVSKQQSGKSQVEVLG